MTVTAWIVEREGSAESLVRRERVRPEMVEMT